MTKVARDPETTALAGDPVSPNPANDIDHEPMREWVPARQPKPGSKTFQLIRLLSGKAGADVLTISQKLGWQAHTTRAAITGLRKAGHPIDHVKGGERKAQPLSHHRADPEARRLMTAGLRSTRGRKPKAASANAAVVLARLEAATAAELRAIWCAARGTPPPATFTARLLRLALAWEAQQREQGGRVSARDWDQVIRRRAAGAKPAEALSGLQPPPAPAGTRLMRVWGGETHEVIVLAEGVLWRGQTWSSLSVVARAITGSVRNGPRFFGLRRKA